MTDKEAWHVNQGYSDSIDYMGEDEELTDLRNDSSMQGLLKYNYAKSDATGVAHGNIDAILAGNRQDKLEKLIEREGSIRATPYLETEEGKQTLFEVAMGSAFPGAAIGRTTKAAITGGQGIINNMPKKLVDEALEKGGFKALTSQVNWNNKLNSTRLLMEKALSKWGVDDRARKLMDPISEMLRTSKYKQN